MTRNTANTLCALLLLIAAVAAALAYTKLPAQVPIHWNAAGDIDGYADKLNAVLLGPGMAALAWLLMWAVPHVSPKGFRTDNFQATVHVLQVVLVAFCVAIGGIILAAGFGVHITPERVFPIAIGALFVVIGNYLGKTQKNFFVGIRTPWTLASDEVWMRTHRMGGYVFVATGAAMVIIGALDLGHFPFMIAVIAAGLMPVAYSFLIYRQLEGFSDDAQNID
ncbi:MAG: SdpI family protein [Pseudomonadota bacterium]